VAASPKILIRASPVSGHCGLSVPSSEGTKRLRADLTRFLRLFGRIQAPHSAPAVCADSPMIGKKRRTASVLPGRTLGQTARLHRLSAPRGGSPALRARDRRCRREATTRDGLTHRCKDVEVTLSTPATAPHRTTAAGYDRGRRA
jgi:hypothetical protein